MGPIGPEDYPSRPASPEQIAAPTLQDLYNQYSALIPQNTGASSAVSSAYDKAMGSISGRYEKALADIDAREQTALGALGTLPAEYRKIYTEGDTSALAGVNRAMDTAQTMPEGYALPGELSSGGFDEAAIAAPFTAAIEGMQSDRMADVPMLEMGTGQYFGGIKGQLSADQANALADLEVRRAESAQASSMEREKLIWDLMGPQAQAEAAKKGMSWTGRFENQEDAEKYYGTDPGGR